METSDCIKLDKAAQEMPCYLLDTYCEVLGILNFHKLPHARPKRRTNGEALFRSWNCKFVHFHRKLLTLVKSTFFLNNGCDQHSDGGSPMRELIEGCINRNVNCMLKRQSVQVSDKKLYKWRWIDAFLRKGFLKRFFCCSCDWMCRD